MLQLQDIHFLEVSLIEVKTRNIYLLNSRKFTVRPKSFIDCLEKNRLPPQEKKTEYEWKEAKTISPIGSRWLMHLLDCPEDASDDIAYIEHFPKKAKDMLQFSRGGENKGWGIYFEEGPQMTGIVFSVSTLGHCG
jgi:hypothetical protein